MPGAWWELLGPATGAGFGLIVLGVLAVCAARSMRSDKEQTMGKNRNPDRDEELDREPQRDPQDPDPDEVNDPAEPRRNPDEPEE